MGKRLLGGNYFLEDTNKIFAVVVRSIGFNATLTWVPSSALSAPGSATSENPVNQPESSFPLLKNGLNNTHHNLWVKWQLPLTIFRVSLKVIHLVIHLVKQLAQYIVMCQKLCYLLSKKMVNKSSPSLQKASSLIKETIYLGNTHTNKYMTIMMIHTIKYS